MKKALSRYAAVREGAFLLAGTKRQFDTGRRMWDNTGRKPQDKWEEEQTNGYF